MDEAYWDQRYRSTGTMWSGHPSPHVVAEVAALVPGSAVDVGCGEGADAIWLAGHGWRVTAVDMSAVALERAAARAAEPGADVADRITCCTRTSRPGCPGPRASTWCPPSSCTCGAPARRAAAPARGSRVPWRLPAGGRSPPRRPADHPAAVAARPVLHRRRAGRRARPPRWEVVVSAARPRPSVHPDGHAVTLHDTVLRARRARDRGLPAGRAPRRQVSSSSMRSMSSPLCQVPSAPRS